MSQHLLAANPSSPLPSHFLSLINPHPHPKRPMSGKWMGKKFLLSTTPSKERLSGQLSYDLA